MPNRQSVFTCPGCDHEDEYLDFSESVTGIERGSYTVADESHEYDGDTDLDRSGDRSYACRNCGDELDLEEIQRHVNHPTEQAAAGLAVFAGNSADETEGSDNIRIMNLKDDATGEAITETQTCECHKCRTLISANGKNKFVVCINPKCGFEFDKTMLSPLTLIPALQ